MIGKPLTFIVGVALALAWRVPADAQAGIQQASDGGNDAAYGLDDACAGVPFTCNAPAEPTIKSSATVTPATIAANLVDGRRITLRPGLYRDLWIPTDDQEIILQPGAVIPYLLIQSTASRIKVRGETARSGRIGPISVEKGATDVYFYQINAVGTAPGNEIAVYGTRVAFVSSSLAMYRYCIYADPATDLIIANSELVSNGDGATPTHRITNSNNTILVDSRVAIDSSHAVYRVQSDGGRSTRNGKRRTSTENGRR